MTTYIATYERRELIRVNLVDAPSAEAVQDYYNAKGAKVYDVHQAEDWEIRDAERKGAPRVTLEEPEAPAAIDAAEAVEAIRAEVHTHMDRSAWDRGVTQYADELLEQLEDALDGGYFNAEDLGARKLLCRALLNGAPNWREYSWAGCALIYGGDIARRLCSPSELKRTRDGARRPNHWEDWLDVQTRALEQAARRVLNAAARVMNGMEE